MSNNIQGKSKVDEIVAAWTKLEKVVTDNVNILERYSKSASNLPSDYVNQVEATRKAQESLNKALEEAKNKQKEYTSLVQAEERIIKKTAKVKADLAKSTSKEAKEYHRLNEAKKAADKLNREEAKSLMKNVGLYNQVQGRIQKLTKQYNDLATKKALGRRLTRAEQKEYELLSKGLNKYQNILKKVDGDIGKHQRNVGNYKSAFNGLNVAVSQIGRELPAATVSMQTFFLGISNNIPMLQDEITKLINKNKELAASGKPTVSIMGKLGKAIFSLTNLMSLGTTLLVIYGSEIIKWTSSLSTAGGDVDELKVKTKALNEAFEGEEIKTAIQNIFELTSTLELAKNGVIDKKEAVEKYNETLGDNLGYVEDLEEAEKNLNDKSEAYIKATLLKATANVIAVEAAQKLAENYKKLVKSEEELTKTKERSEKATGRAKTGRGNLESRIEGSIEDIKKEGDAITEGYQNMYSDIQKEVEKLQAQFDFDLDGNKGNGGSSNTKRDTIEGLGFKSVEDATKEFQDYAKKVIAVLEENFGVEAGKIDPIKLPPLDSEDFEQGLTKLQKATDKFIENLSFKSIDNSPLSSLATFFDGTFDDLIIGTNTLEERFAITFNAIGEVAKETFSLISSLSNQNFENEYANLEKQYQNQLLFAGEGTAARERLEERYEAKRAEIQTRQAKAEKEQALFKIGIDTAQAIVASIAKSPETFGLPFSAFAAAAGALQATLVASTKIPQFWMGTEGGTPSGTIMVNDDPLGIKGNNYREVIKEPSGKLHFPQGKNVKMNVPKGSTVYPTYTDFNAELDRILNVNGINFKENTINPQNQIIQVQNNGATAKDFDRVLTKHFSKIQTNQTIIDKNGIKTLISKGGSKTQIHNNQVEFKGFSV